MAIGDIIVGLDIGASKVCSLVGQVNKFNEVEVIGYGIASNSSVKKGKIVYQLKDRNGNITSYKAQDGVYRKFNKIVVLINENSASASEILTLALKESAGATVVGNRSYGKGTVQETGTLNSGSMVKYTISYWLSPKWNSINKLGIEPDIKVTEVEKQLDEALKAAK